MIYEKMQSKKVEISLIIPVYNVENTLKRCVDSVLNQSYDNYEVILVDDGSTDGSGVLCDQYSSLEKVTVIHKENGGLSSARNAGIGIAIGKYICFVDSDDYVMENYLSAMYDSIESNCCDIVIGGYIIKQNKNFFKNSPKNLVGSYLENEYYDLLLEFAKGNSVFYFAWNKLYKRNLIIENNIRFIDRHCAEDMMFNTKYYAVARSISIIPDCIYVYTVENMDSLSNKRRSGFWEDMKLVLDSYKAIYSNIRINATESQVLNNLVFVLLRNTISNFISNEKFDINTALNFTKSCCEDKVVHEAIAHVSSYGIAGKIFAFFVKTKNYRCIIYSVRLKAFVKWHMFNLFAFLRRSNE